MAKRQDDWRDLDWRVLDQGGTFRGTRGNDHLVGTDFRDTFRIGLGGVDHVYAHRGQDVIYAGDSLTADDRIHGGKGYDTLVLDGDYSDGLTFQSKTLAGIESIDLRGGFDYTITLPVDFRVHNGIAIDASQAKSLHFDGSEFSLRVILVGSGGNDFIVGTN